MLPAMAGGFGMARAQPAAGPPAAAPPPGNGSGLRAVARAAGLTYGAAVRSELLAKDPAYAGWFAAEAQLLVPEWEGKWAALQPAEGQFDLAPLQQVAAFARANGQQLRGHALVWHQAMPDWLTAALAEGADRARAVLLAHLDGVLPATRATIRDWDVVNEPLANPEGSPWVQQTPAVDGLRDTPWLRALGPGYVELAFRLARERDPMLRLTLNEYGVESDTEWAEAKRQRLLRLLRDLLAARCPIDALGIQAHLQMDEPFRAEVLAGFVRQVRELGLGVAITELDVREGRTLPGDLAARDAAVAGRVAEFLGAAIGAGCRTILTWGLSDRDSWLAQEPGVARTDGTTHRGLPLDAEGRRKAMWQAMAAVFAGRPWPGP